MRKNKSPRCTERKIVSSFKICKYFSTFRIETRNLSLTKAPLFGGVGRYVPVEHDYREYFAPREHISFCAN